MKNFKMTLKPVERIYTCNKRYIDALKKSMNRIQRDVMWSKKRQFNRKILSIGARYL